MKTLIAIIAATAIIIFGLSIYLTPNDLKHCPKRPTGQGKCRSVDAIVAVSGGDTLARTQEAVRLYKRGWAETLIFSGAAQDKSGPSNAAVMRQEAIKAGVSPAAILIEEYSETTKENAVKTHQLLEDRQINSVILVTSAYHQRRAGLEFSSRAEGVTVLNHPVKEDKQWSTLWWLTPEGWYLALSEFFKVLLFYVGVTR